MICWYLNCSQKFEDPAEGEDTLVAKFKKLYDDLTVGFRNLEDEARWKSMILYMLHKQPLVKVVCAYWRYIRYRLDMRFLSSCFAAWNCEIGTCIPYMSKVLGVRTKFPTSLKYAHYMPRLAEIMDLLVGSLYTFLVKMNSFFWNGHLWGMQSDQEWVDPVDRLDHGQDRLRGRNGTPANERGLKRK
jgi:hypothetical protein